mmetsp:Transcript_28826/g.43293  ORF Transcript_28826/g.43293 Transcript_28826/m.43293 type:complete len:382 (+) Transcript_28826:141-1286(+)
MTIDKILRYSTVYGFCNPLPDGWEYKQCKKTEKFLHVASTLLDAVDLINTILDLMFAISLIFSQGLVGMGIFLLLGMLFARVVARRGNYFMYRGGLEWAPFFQNPRSYYSRYSPERKNTLKLLYCLTFTELSVYFLENSILILIWLHTKSFDNTDGWEVANGWFTLASAIFAMFLLWVSILYSINCAWCQNSVEKLEHKDGAIKKIFTGMKMMVKLAWKLLCGSIFVLFFLFVVCVCFCAFIYLNLQIITSSEFGFEFLGNGFYFFAGLSWALALFFSCRFWRKANISGENDDTDNDGAAGTPVDASGTQLPLVQGVIVHSNEPVVVATAPSLPPEPLVQAVPVQPNFVANPKKQTKTKKPKTRNISDQFNNEATNAEHRV